MQAFNAIYRHGKLYHQNSNKRIYISEDAEITLTINRKDLLDADPYNSPPSPRSVDELLNEMASKKYVRFKKIADRDDQLEFTIKAGRTKQLKKYGVTCYFTVRLLEELYVIQKTKGKEHGLVSSAHCVVETVYGTELLGFEPIYAYSLNDAYTKTFDFYFALSGKPTANVYNQFFLIKGDNKEPLHKLRMWMPSSSKEQ